MMDRIAFLVGEAWLSARRNGFMTFAAISTVAVALFLLGGTAYLLWRADAYARSIPGKFEMRVFLRDGATFAEVRATASRLREIPGVQGAFWIPRDKAWEETRREQPETTEGIENPYPHAFKVVLSDLSAADQVVASIRAIETVAPGDGIQYLREEQQLVDQLVRVFRWLGGVLGGTLFITAGILIFNAGRLAVLGRQLELRVMSLVGASPTTVRLPFLLEGLLQGAVGGVIAALLIQAAHRVVESQFSGMGALFTVPEFPIRAAIAILAGVGALYGVSCAFLAIQAPVRRK